MNINYKLLGSRIRERRLALQMSQETFGGFANLTPTAISQIENGKTRPALESIVSMAVVLGVSVDTLLTQTLRMPLYEADTVLSVQLTQQFGTFLSPQGSFFIVCFLLH